MIQRSPSATHLLSRGIPVHVVAARLGHASPVTTMRVYARLLPMSDVQGAELVGALSRVSNRFADLPQTRMVERRP
jgi:integrase